MQVPPIAATTGLALASTARITVLQRRLGQRLRRVELADVGAGRERLARADEHDRLDAPSAFARSTPATMRAAQRVAEAVDRRVVERDDGDAPRELVGRRSSALPFASAARIRTQLDARLACSSRDRRHDPRPRNAGPAARHRAPLRARAAVPERASRRRRATPIPEEIVAEMRELGLFGLSLPEEYGGLGLTMEEEVLGRVRARAHVARLPLADRHQQRHRLAGHRHRRHRGAEAALAAAAGERRARSARSR